MVRVVGSYGRDVLVFGSSWFGVLIFSVLQCRMGDGSHDKFGTAVKLRDEISHFSKANHSKMQCEQAGLFLRKEPNKDKSKCLSPGSRVAVSGVFSG